LFQQNSGEQYNEIANYLTPFADFLDPSHFVPLKVKETTEILVL
jgi:hypothetical protein